MTQKGDRLTTTVEVVKVKNEVPTVIIVNGRRYVLKHESQYSGGGRK